MLKKLIVVAATAAVATVGGIGIASAHEAGHGHNSGSNCTSNDTTHQKNKGHQFLAGGNVTGQDVAGNVLGAQAVRPAGLCPTALNDNGL